MVVFKLVQGQDTAAVREVPVQEGLVTREATTTNAWSWDATEMPSKKLNTVEKGNEFL